MEGIGFKPMNIHSSYMIKLSFKSILHYNRTLCLFMKLPQLSFNA